MAQSKKSARLMAMMYGFGAAIVILGALFKILHWPGANIALIVGMFVEALVFAISAFEPIEDHLDWTQVYPELTGGAGETKSKKKEGKVATQDDAQSMLSQKLDNILKEAKLDANLVSSLGTSIQSFQGAVQPLAAASQSMTSTNKYNEQMMKAATSMEKLNGLYQTQVESTSKQASLNTAMVQNSQKLQEQMQSLSTNLSSLNGVYGGMLSAMTKK